MIRAMNSAVSGLKNHQTEMDVIANNIANVNTTAFKANSVRFEDVYNQTLKNASATGANIGGTNPVQVGGGVRVGSIDTNFAPGATETSESGTDVAITGEGFFAVSDGTNNYYTRNGNFKTDPSGALVNADGLYVLDSSGAHIDCSSISSGLNINEAGEVRGTDSSGADTSVATIGLAMFPNPGGLSKGGGSLYAETLNSGAATLDVPGNNGTKLLLPNSLELSNVDLANEFTSMITTERGYQANSRVITTADSMLQELVDLKRS